MEISKTSRNDKGFTLIELMLAMSFLAAILLFATLTFVQALTVYNKGLTIKQINETGRALTADLNRSSNNATSVTVSAATPPQSLCVGETAYIWNLPSVANSKKYISKVNGRDTEITIVRTNEGFDGTIYCKDNSAGTIVLDATNVTNLIGDQAKVLDVSIAQPDAAASALEAPLVRFTITIGTRSTDGAVDPIKPVSSSYWSCPAGGLGTFCAVGTYTTTIYFPSGS